MDAPTFSAFPEASLQENKENGSLRKPRLRKRKRKLPGTAISGHDKRPEIRRPGEFPPTLRVGAASGRDHFANLSIAAGGRSYRIPLADHTFLELRKERALLVLPCTGL